MDESEPPVEHFLVEGSHNLCLPGHPLVLGNMLPLYSPSIRHKSVRTKTVSTYHNVVSPHLCLYSQIQSKRSLMITENSKCFKKNVFPASIRRKGMLLFPAEQKKIKQRLSEGSQDGVQVQPVKSTSAANMRTRGPKHQPHGGGKSYGTNQRTVFCLWLLFTTVSCDSGFPFVESLANQSDYKHPIREAVTARTLSNLF